MVALACSFSQSIRYATPQEVDTVSGQPYSGHSDIRVSLDLEGELLKAHAVEFYGVKTLRNATREQVENFVQYLVSTGPKKDRNTLPCQLDSYLGTEGEGTCHETPHSGLNETTQTSGDGVPDGVFSSASTGPNTVGILCSSCHTNAYFCRKG